MEAFLVLTLWVGEALSGVFWALFVCLAVTFVLSDLFFVFVDVLRCTKYNNKKTNKNNGSTVPANTMHVEPPLLAFLGQLVQTPSIRTWS
jgi:hypothetical protein